MNTPSKPAEKTTSSKCDKSYDPISEEHLNILSESTEPVCESTVNKSFINHWWKTAQDAVRRKQIIISKICEESATKDKLEEYICIENIGPFDEDISGWKINAGSDGQDYVFPPNEILTAGNSIKIYTLRKSKNSFKSKTPLWNNRGDTGLLTDANGNEIFRLSYGQDAAAIVYLSEIQYDGVEGRGEADEYAEITNCGNAVADISDWRINARARA